LGVYKRERFPLLLPTTAIAAPPGEETLMRCFLSVSNSTEQGGEEMVPDDLRVRGSWAREATPEPAGDEPDEPG
jgi:hypothetical protein